MLRMRRRVHTQEAAAPCRGLSRAQVGWPIRRRPTCLLHRQRLVGCQEKDARAAPTLLQHMHRVRHGDGGLAAACGPMGGVVAREDPDDACDGPGKKYKKMHSASILPAPGSQAGPQTGWVLLPWACRHVSPVGATTISCRPPWPPPPPAAGSLAAPAAPGPLPPPSACRQICRAEHRTGSRGRICLLQGAALQGLP